jgi:hypothetical protein
MPSKFLLRNFDPTVTYHLRHETKPGMNLFDDPADFKSFILTLSYYLRFPDGAPLSWVPRLNPKTLASKQGLASRSGQLPCTLHAFLLLPDHFHFVLTENVGGSKAGISELMRRLSVGYAMTYRKKYGGSGTIYKGKYKMTPLTQSESGSLISYLHTHPAVNPTYLHDPLHSSLPDYEGASRSWLKPLPTLPSSDLPPKLSLEK